MLKIMWKTLMTLWAAQLMGLAAGYRILCVFPVPSRSHDALGRGFVTALLKAGHTVDWATPYMDNQPHGNLTLIDVSDTLRFESGMSNIDDAQKFSDVNQVQQYAENVSFVTVKNKNLLAALEKNQYDAVVTEWFFSDIYAGLAAVQKVPWVAFNSVCLHPYLEYLVDEVRSISTIPMMITSFSMPMNFFERIKTSLIILFSYYVTRSNLPATIKFYDEQFSALAAARGATLPPFEDALHNISILFVNSHPSYYPAQSLPPNIVEIGGFHIDDNIPALPRDIQQILDSSPQGVVYFSMGSLLKSSSLSHQKRNDLLQVLGELPYTVLWKFEAEEETLPKNVHVRPWLPQLSVLSHPNVKLFVSHGGLLSMMEAIHCGVPVLAIPIYGDQPANAMRAIEAGFGQRLTYSDNMARDLRVLLNEMLRNESYSNRAKHLSRLFKNRVVPPDKLISHYVEIAIESKGAHHLRSKARLYSWYQRWMIDQLLLLVFVLYLFYKTVCLSASYVFRKVRRSNKTVTKKNRQKVKNN